MLWRAHKAMLAEPTAEGRKSSRSRAASHRPFVEMRMNLEAYRISSEPFYQPADDENAVLEAMTSSDLAGRYLLEPDGTVWHDGPLTMAVRYGAICYLDEIVEARQDTTVVIHPLTDARRILPLEKHNEIVPAHADFQLTISYNPGYQSAVKDLKESTKQRFLAIDFSYPPPAVEAAIVAREAGTNIELAGTLVAIAERSRNLQGPGLDEGGSTRRLIHAARRTRAALPLEAAVRSSIVLPITDDHDIRAALTTAIQACIP